MERDRMKFTILNVFDFDDTLVRSVGPQSFKIAKQLRPDLDLEAHQLDDNRFNWWDHPISLDTELFNIPLIEPVYAKYKESLENVEMCNAIITHRAQHMEPHIRKLLEEKNIHNIHEFYANRLTVSKSEYLKMILYNYPKIKHINIYEDSIKNINDYYTFLESFGGILPNVKFYLVNTMGTFDLQPPINYTTYAENNLIF